MTVNELADLLAGYIAEGRGSDRVFVGLTGEGVINQDALDALDPYNWEVYEVDGNDGRSHFVQLYAEPKSG